VKLAVAPDELAKDALAPEAELLVDVESRSLVAEHGELHARSSAREREIESPAAAPPAIAPALVRRVADADLYPAGALRPDDPVQLDVDDQDAVVQAATANTKPVFDFCFSAMISAICLSSADTPHGVEQRRKRRVLVPAGQAGRSSSVMGGQADVLPGQQAGNTHYCSLPCGS